jgi:hypothetical protein
MPVKPKKLLIILFKISVVVGAYGFIAYKIGFDPTLQNQILNEGIDTQSAYLILLALLLMPVNWGLEALKWKILLNPMERINLFTSFKGVLAGLSIAIFTPNRTGDYIGRIWVLKQRNRIAGISITIAGSLAQSTVTFIVGLIAGWYWLSDINNPEFTSQTQMIIASAITTIVILTYVFLPRICQFALKFKWKKVIRTALQGIGTLKPHHQYTALIISILRYTIFTSQFILLLHYFNCNMGVFDSIIAIGLLYGAMLIIPSITIAEPGIRSSLSLMIFTVFSQNEAGILAASLTLWIINLAIPALSGALYLAALKIDKPW